MMTLNWVLFLWVTINFFAMTAVILSAKNGRLKYFLSFFLITLGLGSIVRMLSAWLSQWLSIDEQGVLVASIVLVGQLSLTWCYHRTYGRQKQ